MPEPQNEDWQPLRHTSFLDVPASCRPIALGKTPEVRGLRVSAVCTERELKPAQAGKSSGGQAATPTIRVRKLRHWQIVKN